MIVRSCLEGSRSAIVVGWSVADEPLGTMKLSSEWKEKESGVEVPGSSSAAQARSNM